MIIGRQFIMDYSFETIFTFSLSTLGAGLGVLNFWRDASRERVKLKVTLKRIIVSGNQSFRANFAIQVINLSTFTINIREVGFTSKRKGFRVAIIDPIIIDGIGKYPFKLESRSALTVYVNLLDSDQEEAVHAYASTSCGFERIDKKLKVS